jgi:hypothetical protein
MSTAILGPCHHLISNNFAPNKSGGDLLGGVITQIYVVAVFRDVGWHGEPDSDGNQCAFSKDLM